MDHHLDDTGYIRKKSFGNLIKKGEFTGGPTEIIYLHPKHIFQK